MNTSALANIPQTWSQLASITKASEQHNNIGDAYLKFLLNEQTPAVISMNQAQEVLVLPQERLTPMPNMPLYVQGLMNRRSRVLWVIDLAQMLGLPTVETNVQQYNIVTLRNQSASLGVAVQSIEGVLRLTPDCIQSPLGQVSSGLVPYLRGCALQEQEILLVLDGLAIMASSLLHNT
ncbi:MAG: purine-binding chemotaxis protein CheW [Moorea sp. SIO3I7]|uniref:Chemotaxis protein CheW n=1 Tax=Moorena bouillonii PNG TaxID=568701 RepID=A0A1U7MZU9_9CYAN|nr:MULTISPECIES: chemotaxis protein CheW [Moorena]NEO03315.1 purine-binding chemotaxis protein CheW [Moorena sp. SIO3I7]NEO47007.1 purine-binding chemotaxis protein CheW [Moorena sp. SIO4A3]NEO59612.1 purine-binding chemotaxis protein CheW [Moorena sp. SIO4G2]NEO10821.1 purine-binding chemotaxis protein CheW [Moorena sp. SIO3E8]NEP21079.1 purine-binding chemotaxis protein CheW [Moorena sp. SIO3I6]